MEGKTVLMLLGAAILLHAGGALAADGEQGMDDGLKLWYRQPAANWNEALPVGNGRLGAMVFGTPGEALLQLNEDSLWSGGPQDANNPEALEALPEVRRLLFAGKYAEAEQLTLEKMTRAFAI